MSDEERRPDTGEEGPAAEKGGVNGSREQMGTAAFFSDDTQGDGEGTDPEVAADSFRPVKGWKVWGVITGVLLVIAVGILYVYQAGDRKTILGNQPIPAAINNMYALPAAANIPVGGAVQSPLAAGPNLVQRSANSAQGKTTLTCPNCGATGLPVCATCGAVMQPVNQGTANQLFACPVCGTVGVAVCPHCHALMSAPAVGSQPLAQTQAPAAGGQFYCPVCGATGLPNWNAAAVPICPNCQNQMQVK